MRKTFFLIPILLLVIGLTNHHTAYSQREIARITSNGTVAITIPLDTIKSYFLQTTNFRKKIASIDRAEITVSDDPDDEGRILYYLQFGGSLIGSTPDSRCFTFSIELEERDDGIYPIAPDASTTTHSCSGVKCMNCSGYTAKDGCRCRRSVPFGAGYCNHTVTTTTTSLTIPLHGGGMWDYATFHNMLYRYED